MVDTLEEGPVVVAVMPVVGLRDLGWVNGYGVGPRVRHDVNESFRALVARRSAGGKAKNLSDDVRHVFDSASG
jgi:hypothetical protein